MRGVLAAPTAVAFGIAAIVGVLGFAPPDPCTLKYTFSEPSLYYTYSCAGDCTPGQSNPCEIHQSDLDDDGLSEWQCKCNGANQTVGPCHGFVESGPAPYRQPQYVVCTTLNCTYDCVNNTPGQPGGGGAGTHPVCRCPG